MIDKHLMPFPDGDRHAGNRQHLDGVALLQVALAEMRICRLARELPPGGGVVEERIAKLFRSFVRERGHVLESTTEDAWRDPACILSDPAGLRYRTRLKEIGVEPEHAAPSRSIGIVHVERKQKGVGEQGCVQGIGGEMTVDDLV